MMSTGNSSKAQSLQDLQRVLTNMALSKENLISRLSDRSPSRDPRTSSLLSSRATNRPPRPLTARSRVKTARTTASSSTASTGGLFPFLPKISKSATSELYCGPCSRDGTLHEADGFCIECSEYFCETCINHHKNLKITKMHVVRDRKKMPKIKHHIEDEDSTETCERHPGELIRYHCPDHDDSCCGICATLDHRQCIHLAYIPAMKAKKMNKSCVKMIRHIESLVGQFERARKETSRNIKQLDTQQEDFQQCVTRFHQEIYDALRLLERATLRDMNYLQSDEQGFLSARLEMCDDTIKTLRQASNNLELAMQNGVESKSFLQLKKASKQVSMYESLLDDIRMKNLQPLQFKFGPSISVRQFFRQADSLGTVDVAQRTKKSAIFLTQFSARSRSDPYEMCDITGCAALPDGRLVLADMSNETIKLTDPGYKITTQYKLSSDPWDVCVISNDQILVSLPREKKLQFLNIKVTLRPLKKIGNAGVVNPSQFYGVAHFQDKLFTTCPKDDFPNVKILDMQGKLLHQISTDAHGNSLFSDPLYITTSINGRSIYVSDSGKNAVIRSSADGKAEIHQTPDSGLPAGITVQPDRRVFVCSLNTSTVQQISAMGEFVTEIIGSEGSLTSPQAITYCPKERRLIVSMQKSETVKVFQLC